MNALSASRGRGILAAEPGEEISTPSASQGLGTSPAEPGEE